MRVPAGIVLLLTATSLFWSCSTEGVRIETWVADPHHRVYHGSFGRDTKQREIKLEAARNEYVIFQLAAKSSQDLRGLVTEVSEPTGQDGTIPAGPIRVRYPGFLPVDEGDGVSLRLRGLESPVSRHRRPAQDGQADTHVHR